MKERNKYIIGSRGSKLALIQANWIKSQLEDSNDEIEFSIEIIKTTGDNITDEHSGALLCEPLFFKLSLPVDPATAEPI